MKASIAWYVRPPTVPTRQSGTSARRVHKGDLVYLLSRRTRLNLADLVAEYPHNPQLPRGTRSMAGDDHRRAN